MINLIAHYLSLSLFIAAFIVVIGGGIYLLLRPFVLWYFKIYTIESELKINNALLREIRDELRKKNIQTPTSTQQPKEDYSKYMPR